MDFIKRITRILNPGRDPDLDSAFQYSEEHLPTLWLLGKTGAGKSSLVQALTGLDQIEIGAGFRPCTMTSSQYLFPPHKPLLAFLDTRGLAEASYDPKEDIEACEGVSHALILVMKAEDPEQSDTLAALKRIRSSGQIRSALLVHSAIEAIADPGERQRCVDHNQAQVERVWGPIDSVQVDLVGADGKPVNLPELVSRIGDLLPIVAELFARRRHDSAEEANFQRLKAEVMWYAGAAGATDAVPVLGLVTVPTLQTKMLHSLANRYGLIWSRRLLAEFGSAMGMGFGMQYASRLGLQQLAKLIPGYGQTVGAASAAVASYGFTYALGRVACMYFYRKTRGETASPEELKAKFRQAFEHILPVARDDVQKNP